MHSLLPVSPLTGFRTSEPRLWLEVAVLVVPPVLVAISASSLSLLGTPTRFVVVGMGGGTVVSA